MKNKLGLVILVTFLLWVLNQLFLFKAPLFLSCLAIGTLLILLLTRNLVQPFRKHGWLVWLISPILFWLAVSLYATIITGYVFIQIIFLVMASFFYLYFITLNSYLINKTPELNKKFDNLILSSGFLTCAASGASLYGLTAFVSLPTGFLLLFFMPVAAFLFIQFASLKKNFWPENKSLLLIEVLILMELAVVLSFLPLNFNLLGFALGLGYFFLLSIMRLRWQERLDQLKVKRLVILSIVIVFILFFSARWL
jgi:hypothetical protein